VTRRAFAYFDTSVIAKRYLREAGSQQSAALLRKHRFLSSALTPVELQSLIQRKRREETLTEVQTATILRKIEDDRGRWELVAISGSVLARAEEIVRDYDIRTLDAIHLSAAVTINLQLGGNLPFATADLRQSVVAKDLTLSVLWVS
jgi:predicted nucleic acid-binding protein